MALATAGAAGAAGAALGAAGQIIRRRQRPDLDELLSTPAGITHHYVDTPDGARIHVVEAGSGSPVLFLHGVLLQWWVWNSMFHLLGSRHRVIAWDMRGHGESTIGTDGLTLEAMAGDLAAVLDALDIQGGAVVGHSMGGMVLGRALADAPSWLNSRVTHCGFVATAASLGPIPGVSPLSTAMFHVLAAVSKDHPTWVPIERLWRPGNLSAVLVRTAFGRTPSSVAIEQVRQMVSSVGGETASRCMEAVASHNVAEQLADVDTVSTVVVGTRDLLTPPHFARILHEKLRRSTLHIFDGAGHQVMQEQPRELADAIDALLRTPGLRGGTTPRRRRRVADRPERSAAPTQRRQRR